jgi:acetyl esterase/lipase
LTEDNYILVGHSCGATLAFQALQRSCDSNAFPAPKAVVGLAGIYDICLLFENHRDGPYADIYASFIEGAFGPDRKEWARVSPTHFAASNMYAGRVILLVTADDDVMLEPQQREVMRRTVLSSHGTVERDLEDETNELEACIYSEMAVRGGHDEMWLHGENMVAAIRKVLSLMPGES